MNFPVVPVTMVATDEMPVGQVPMKMALFNEAGEAVTAIHDAVAWDDVTGKPSTFPPATHTHVGSAVVLTGYTSGSAGNVSAADTVNQALAKLEARIAALETP